MNHDVPFFGGQILGAFWHPEMPYLIATAVALAALLYFFRPEYRAPVFHTLGLYAASLAALWSGAVLAALEFAAAAAVLREAAVIASGIAIIRLSGLFVFRVALRWVRIDPPRIVEDMLVMLGYLAWGMVRLRYAGLDLSQIVTTSALMTAVLAFSMQDTLGNLLGPKRHYQEKDAPFECGFEAFENARMKFDVRYYLVAILNGKKIGRAHV